MDHRQRGVPAVGPVVQGRLRPPRAQAVVRERLDRRLDLWSHRLTLVSGPAGAGKTVAALQAAHRAEAPVFWYRAAPEDGSVAALLAHLHGAIVVQGSFAEITGTWPWASVQEALAGLERWRGDRALLVVDDLQFLWGTPAERALERLVDDAPPWLHLLAATRRRPDFNLPRLRVSGELSEMTADDLRFRRDEVLDLFATCFRRILPPEHAAWLTHETEGWAAALRLFHLATASGSATRRPRASTSAPYRLVDEYLDRNILRPLPRDLRRFMLDTAVLDHLTGDRCDALLRRSGSNDVLAELVERNVLVTWVDDQEAYRVHRQLHRLLTARLLEEQGPSALRARYRAAGRVLEQDGAFAESLQAFRRSAAPEDVARVLHRGAPALPRRAEGDPGFAHAAGPTRMRARPRSSAALAPVPPPLLVRCLGGFALELAGRPVAIDEIRPRARSLLRLLSAHAGRPVHVEALVGALWPDLGSAAGKRSLQVAVSSVRSLLRTHGGAAAGEYVQRPGDAYRLAPPDDAWVDVAAFARRLTEAHLSARSGDRTVAAEGFEAALRLYRGELLPEEGSADWVLERRRELLLAATSAAEELAVLRLQLGDPRRAIAACEQGLALDRCTDRLWRLLLTALHLSGDAAGAARAERDYRAVLRELGVAGDIAPLTP